MFLFCFSFVSDKVVMRMVPIKKWNLKHSRNSTFKKTRLPLFCYSALPWASFCARAKIAWKKFNFFKKIYKWGHDSFFRKGGDYPSVDLGCTLQGWYNKKRNLRKNARIFDLRNSPATWILLLLARTQWWMDSWMGLTAPPNNWGLFRELHIWLQFSDMRDTTQRKIKHNQ